MPGIEGVSAINQQANSVAKTDSATLSQDFDNFLLLLTTQLQNQDPLSPVSSTEFTNQLVSFSGVEQQIKGNQLLEDSLALDVLNITNTGLGFIGLDIESLGEDISFDGSSPQTVGYELSETATQSNINILDENGTTVFSANGETGIGEHRFTWDGTNNDGQLLPAGNYTLKVGALDQSDNALTVSTTVPNRVTGIESDGKGDVILIVSNGNKVPITAVRRAEQPGA